MGITILRAVSVCLLLFSFGCSQEEPAQKVNLDKREKIEISRQENSITYAYLPQYSHRVSYHRHHLLIDYLREETGLKIKQVFPNTFDEHLEMVGQGKIDISYSNPFAYVMTAHRFGARAFARTVETYGRDRFRGQIICRADNPEIRDIADCKGKRWIAVDSGSAGGYLYPLGLFRKHGLRKEDFSEIAFAPGPGGKQEKVVLAVNAGKYDVGSIREGTLNVVSDKIDIRDIRVIAHTPWYPGWVYFARAGLDLEVLEKIRKALLTMDYRRDEYRPILAAADIVGVIPSEDRDYDQIRGLASDVGISLD